MSLKLSVTILGLGMIALALVAVREIQTRAANQLIRARVRIVEQDKALWDLRSRIAREVTPATIHERLRRLEEASPEIAPPDSEAAWMPPLAAVGLEAGVE